MSEEVMDHLVYTPTFLCIFIYNLFLYSSVLLCVFVCLFFLLLTHFYARVGATVAEW